MTSNLAQVLKVKKMARRIGKLSTTERAKLEKMFTSGPAAYESARNLQATSKMPKAKIDTFLQQKDAHTKYRQIQRKFPRLKVIAYEINEIWSIDVAYVDKLAKYNNGVKYLLVAVDVLSRFLRVVPKIEHLKRLEEQRSLSAKVYTRDERLIFRNYVLALCHEMAPSGNINHLRHQPSLQKVKSIQASHGYPRIYSIDCRKL